MSVPLGNSSGPQMVRCSQEPILRAQLMHLPTSRKAPTSFMVTTAPRGQQQLSRDQRNPLQRNTCLIARTLPSTRITSILALPLGLLGAVSQRSQALSLRLQSSFCPKSNNSQLSRCAFFLSVKPSQSLTIMTLTLNHVSCLCFLVTRMKCWD